LPKNVIIPTKSNVTQPDMQLKPVQPVGISKTLASYHNTDLFIRHLTTGIQFDMPREAFNNPTLFANQPFTDQPFLMK